MISGIQSQGFSTLAAQRSLRLNALQTTTALNRLATGRRINSAADNPAGLIASTSLASSIAQLDAQTDINSRAANKAATADGALGSVSDLLIRAKTLTVANADSTLSPTEKQANQIELDSIVNSVDRIGSTTSFNGQKLFDGNAVISTVGDGISIGSISAGSLGNVTVDSANHSLADLSSGKPLNIATGDVAGASQSIEKAISDVSTLRGKIGAFSNGVSAAQSSATNARINLASSLSTIQDADFAQESSRRIRSQILGRASLFALQTSVFSLANTQSLLDNTSRTLFGINRNSSSSLLGARPIFG